MNKMKKAKVEKKPNRLQVAQARASLSHLLRRANAGERITILDRNVPVAELGPVTSGSDSHWAANTPVLPAARAYHPGAFLSPGPLSLLDEQGNRTTSLDVLLKDRRRR